MSRRSSGRGAQGPVSNAGEQRTAAGAGLSSARRPAQGWIAPAAAALVALAALVVFRGTLRYFFSQDDFAGLAHANGLDIRHEGWWRWMSRQAYWSVLWPVAGQHAIAYHALGLGLHTLNGVLLFQLLRARVSIAAALAAAVFYAAHPSHFTSLYWASAAGDLMATTGVLAVVLLARRTGARRFWALPAFALAVLSKEHALAAPLIVLLDRTWPGRDTGDRAPAVRDPLLLALLALMVAGVAGVVAHDAFGVRAGVATSSAYSSGLGPHVLANLLTYAGWSVHIAVFAVSSFSDAVEPSIAPLGALVLALLLAGGAWRPLRERGWIAGAALFLLTLLPVLPLRHHTYHYYLTLPLAGVAWCLAAAADRALAPLGTRAIAGALATVCAALLAINGALLVRTIETHPFLVDSMRSDPVVDRARIAAHVRDGLVSAGLPPGTALRIWAPRVFQPATARGDQPAGETYWESNLRSALMDGLAVRVMVPAVREVRFVTAFEPGGDAAWAVARIDGMVQVRSAAELAALLQSQPEIR